jgi:hypothetical protein
MTRNELLCARKHLPLHERVRVFQKILRRILPAFSLGEPSKHIFIQRFYWETARYFREINRRRYDPYYQAQFYGILDYLRRRFGDCPSTTRMKLIKKPDDATS